MKRIFMIFTLTFITIINFYPQYLHASEMFVNDNGIEISKEENERLLSLGFTPIEIKQLSKEDYERDKGLYGELVSQEVDSDLLRSTVTEYKMMTTSIYKLSNNVFRYKVNLKWKLIPKVRSYDVIGIGIEDNVSIIGNTSCNLLTNSSSINNNVYQTKNGIYSVVKIPEGSLDNMQITLSFDVKVNSGNRITAYGDYAHATKIVNLANAKRVTVSTSGIVLPSDLVGSYDEIKVDQVSYTL